MSPQQDPDPVWEMHLIIKPTKDGRFVRVESEIRKPDVRPHLTMSSAGTSDMMYERAQEVANNGLRQITNDIQRKLVLPNKQPRR